MQPVPQDVTTESDDEYAIHDCTPQLYPRYPTADTVTKRNEFVYQFPDDGFKLVIGPVKRTSGWLWRVELHPDSMTESNPEFFPTFSAALARAQSYADDRLA